MGNQWLVPLSSTVLVRDVNYRDSLYATSVSLSYSEACSLALSRWLICLSLSLVCLSPSVSVSLLFLSLCSSLCLSVSSSLGVLPISISLSHTLDKKKKKKRETATRRESKTEGRHGKRAPRNGGQRKKKNSPPLFLWSCFLSFLRLSSCPCCPYVLLKRHRSSHSNGRSEVIFAAVIEQERTTRKRKKTQAQSLFLSLSLLVVCTRVRVCIYIYLFLPPLSFYLLISHVCEREREERKKRHKAEAG